MCVCILEWTRALNARSQLASGQVAAAFVVSKRLFDSLWKRAGWHHLPYLLSSCLLLCCSLGASWGPLGELFGLSWRPLEGLFGPSWCLPGGICAPGPFLGRSWSLWGRAWPAPGSLFGRPWRLLGRSWADLGPHLARFGGLLDLSWGLLGRSWQRRADFHENLNPTCVLRVRFGLPGVQVGLKLAQVGPKLAQVGPKLKPSSLKLTRS